jgi:hypothetical protein
MVNGSWSKSELEVRPQHRASEHTRSLASAGRAIDFPEVAQCYERRKQFCKMEKIKALHG